MAKEQPYRIKSISKFHELRGLPKPEHPLISLVNVADTKQLDGSNFVLDFYSIFIKREINGKLTYGQKEYDFDEGLMCFIAPNQIFGVEHSPDDLPEQPTGWMLLIHPDFIWNTSLAKKIKQYEFFGYSVNEALWLSEKEETILNNILTNIKQEYHSNIDEHSQTIIIAQIELLLSYAERFYHRQFITRKKANHQILDRLEKLLDDYLNSGDVMERGLPTVQYIAGTLNISPSYLSSMLKVLTGQNTQQHIHDKLIEKAKEKLSTTNLSVSEIAYELGFEHLPSFSKLFKSKTNQSPMEFRASFN